MFEILGEIVGYLIAQLVANKQEAEASHNRDDESHCDYEKNMRSNALIVAHTYCFRGGLVRGERAEIIFMGQICIQLRRW